MNSIYSGIEEARNGTKIPVFLSGRTMESRYNPERDALNMCMTLECQARFFLVTGIGSGLFIKHLNEKYSDSKIIAIENSAADISFLMQLDTVKELSKNPNIILTGIEKLFENILNNYLPAKYGDLKIIEQRPWLTENPEAAARISEAVNRAAGIVSADFSVQAHFGKLWLKNIMENSQLLEKLCHNTEQKSFLKLSKNALSKTAVVAAAGPSLDEFIESLDERQISNFFFITTDTAFSSLYKHNIEADFCISIDGQSVSYNHFLHKLDKCKTIFCFDLCANFSAAKNLYASGHKLFFFCSGHPLASAINNSANHIMPELFSGSGTVTITAVDFAIKLGFKNIIIPGADFSYSNGKAYTSGTYLESLYHKSSSKIKNSETAFSSLMYRTPLTPLSSERFTTQVLNAYKTSLENYLFSNNISFNLDKGYYRLSVPESFNILLSEAKCNFSLSSFMNKFRSSNPLETEIILLPYIAWLRNNPAYKNNSYEELLKLAFNTIVSYNI